MTGALQRPTHAEDEKNKAAGHDEEATCNSKCPSVRPEPEPAVAEEEMAAYATASLAHPISPRLLEAAREWPVTVETIEDAIATRLFIRHDRYIVVCQTSP